MMTNTRRTTNIESLVDAVISVLSTGDILGCTADEIAVALEMPIDGAALQHDLEDMVDRGILDRRGVGRGALYTLVTPVRGAKTPTGVHLDALELKGPSARKAG